MVIPSLSAQVEFGIPLDDGVVFGRLYGCVLIILGITFRLFSSWFSLDIIIFLGTS